MSVAELLPGTGSMVPAAASTVAVFTSDPVADADSVAVSVNVATPPTGRSTVVSIEPVPEPVVHTPPDDPTQVQLAPISVLGTVSTTCAPTTVDGPALATVIVYATVLPATTDVTPSVLAIDKSARGISASVSVAELLPGTGSEIPTGTPTDAVLTSRPRAAGSTIALIVYVTVAPTGKLTVSAIDPDPAATPHTPPPAPLHVHVAPIKDAGIASDTDAPTTADGPLFVTTTEYTTGSPGTATIRPSSFVTARSATWMIVSTSVALSFAGVESITPTGTAIVAVFANVPVAVGSTVPETENVADEPAARSIVPSIDVVPDGAGQVAPAPGVQVQLTPVRPGGNVSLTDAAGDGELADVVDRDRVGHGATGDDARLTVGLADLQIGDRCDAVAVDGHVVRAVVIDEPERCA